MARDELHVLVYGSIDSAVCDTLRIGQFVEPLASRGVLVRTLAAFPDDVLNGGSGRPGSEPLPGAGSHTERLRDLGLIALAWADIIVFRRWQSTHAACSTCGHMAEGPDELGGHLRTTGHLSVRPDPILRPLVALLASHPELTTGRGIVYETDDDVLDVPSWTGLGRTAALERDLIREMIGLADLVATTTPVLADRLRPEANGEVRVIRNAVDPTWYPPRPTASSSGSVRVLYHGGPLRLRDYEVARPAIDRLAAVGPPLRRVWLGASHEPRVHAVADEVHAWVEGPRAFAQALVNATPDIGVAPLLDEPFNRAKSELHWLEYAMAGAPCVATDLPGGGPFDVIRDGVDGVLARDAAGWHAALHALVTSPELRVRMAAEARRRVLHEYSVEVRVAEWERAFHDALAIGRDRRPTTPGQA